MVIMSRKVQFATVTFIGILLLAFSSSHPIGNTGAPGDGDCGNCHGGGSFPGSQVFTWFDDPVQPSFLLEFDTGIPTEFGWQMTILDDSNNPVGSWVGAPTNASVKTSGGQEWLGHDPSIFINSGSFVTEGLWDPQGYSGDINIYVAVNTTNGNGNTSGDEVHLEMYTETITASSDPLTVDISLINDPICNGDCNGALEALPMGGVAPFSYDWSDGSSDRIADGLCAGNYDVTVTDDMGDTATASMSLSDPDVLELTSFQVEAGCFGDNFGAIEIIVTGGVPDYDFDWSTGSSDSYLENLTAGTYTITVTDDAGCSEIMSFTITEYPAITIDFDVVNPTGTDANGSITAIAGGGSPNFMYEWNTGETTATISGLEEDLYQVTVTDSQNCTQTAEIFLESMANPCSVSAVAETVPPACNGGLGTVNLNVSGQTDPLSYSWSDGSINPSLSAPTGSYEVTIMDAAGCLFSINNIFISEPDSLFLASTSVTAASCGTVMDGELTVNFGGGVGDYTCLLYTSPSPRDATLSRMPSSA